MAKLNKMALLALLACIGCSQNRVTVAPDSPHGIIATGAAQIAKDVYAVRVVEIDGRRVNPQLKAFWLAPGRHSIRVSAILDRPTTGLPTRTTNRRDQSGNITLLVEEGRRYVIGAKLFGQRLDEWSAQVITTGKIDGYADSE